MGTLSRPTPSIAYGIDDSGGRLTVVRAARRRAAAAFTVVCDQLAAPDRARTDAALQAMAAEVAAGGAVTAAGLPAGAGLARWLATPFPSRSKAIRVLPSLLDLQLPFPVEQCRHQVAAFRRDPDGHVQALAVAVRIADLDQRLADLAAGGLDPLTIDHEGLALWSESQRLANPPRVVAWLGADRFTLVIGDAQGFLSAHGFRFGARTLAEDAALGQWAARVQHVVRSQAGAGDDRLGWLWAGSGAEDPDLRRRLESALPAQMDFALAPAPGAFLATALARRALDATSADCNLRIGSQAHPQLALRERRTLLRTSAAALLAGALLAGAGIGGRLAFDARDRAAQREVTELAMDLTGLPAVAIARGNEVFITRQHLPEDREAGDPFSRALAPGPSQALNQGIQTAFQLNLRISSWAARDRSFTIRGTAPEWTACENYARILREQGMEVDLQRASENEGASTGFVLKGGWGDG
jgi:hypothetical protein